MDAAAGTSSGALDHLLEPTNDRLRPIQWTVLVICFLIAIVDGFDVSAMAVAAPAVAASLSVPIGQFGPALSASLFGLMAGGAIGGPAGDRLGRKPSLLAFFAVGLLAACATGFATNLTQLTALRFLTGLALGGTIPLAAALTAEFMPPKRRAFLLVVMFTGHPLGGALAGLVSPDLIETFGWPSVFFAGGVLPVVILIAVFAVLPESPVILARRGQVSALNRVLSKLGVTKDPVIVRAELAPNTTKASAVPIRELFAAGAGGTTLVLWALFFATQFQLFFLASWLPSLLTDMGHTLRTASFSATAFEIGGLVGAIALGQIASIKQPAKVLVPAYFAGSIAVGLIVVFNDNHLALFGLAAIAGVGALATQLCLNALTTQRYDAVIRATGLGWALSVGRLGSVASPLVAGTLLSAGASSANVLLLGVVPPLFCIIGVICLAKLDAAPRGVAGAVS